MNSGTSVAGAACDGVGTKSAGIYWNGDISVSNDELIWFHLSFTKGTTSTTTTTSMSFPDNNPCIKYLFNGISSRTSAVKDAMSLANGGLWTWDQSPDYDAFSYS